MTSLDHLIAGHANGVGEDDLSHLTEILELHDLKRDPDAGDRVSFVERSQRNFENRCLCHHVFDAALAVRLVEHAGMQVRTVEEVPSMHILVVTHKPRA